MLRSSKLASRIRVFDLILNLGVHGHLLEPMFPEICSTIEEEASEMSYNNDEDLAEQRKKHSFYMEQLPSIGKFESWMSRIFYEVLLLLVQVWLKFMSIAVVLAVIFVKESLPSAIIADRRKGGNCLGLCIELFIVFCL